MRKWLLVALSACVLLVTAACGAGDDGQKAQEVFEKSIQAMEGVNSFNMDMNMKQEIPFGEEVIKTDTKMSGDVVIEPMTMHQKMNMSAGDEESMEMEMYITEDSIYVWEAMSETWMKMPEELFGEMMALEDMQTNPTDELEKLKEYVDEFTYKEEGNNYILSLSASGDKFKELIKDTLAEFAGDDDASLNEMMDMVEINKINYELKIDKKTYYQNELNMNMDLTITIDGESTTIKQNVHAVFSNFNGIDEIVVPQEVIDSAIEMNF